MPNISEQKQIIFLYYSVIQTPGSDNTHFSFYIYTFDVSDHVMEQFKDLKCLFYCIF